MFESLIESRSRRDRSRTWFYFAVASLVWTMVLAGVAVAGIVTYDGKLDADFENLALVAVVNIPAPARAAVHEAKASASRDEFYAATKAPTEIAEYRPTPPRIGGVPDGLPIGDPVGDADGWLGDGKGTDPVAPTGTGNGTIVPPDPPRLPDPEVKVDPPKRVVVSKGPLNGVAIYRDQPAFPQIARQAGITSTVVVEVTVSEQGSVIGAHAISGHPFFTRVAEQSARNWRFSPTTLGGVPVKVVGTITFVFKKSA